MTLDPAPSGPRRLMLQKAGYDNGWTLQPARVVPAALDAPPWMTLRSQNAPGQVALAIAADGFALRTAPAVMRLLAAEGHGRPQSDHLALDGLAELRAACLRDWHLHRALPAAPGDALAAALAAQGQGWAGPASQDLDPARATTRSAQVRLRVGQDVFRAALDDYWGGRCPLTGIADRALLRASHVVPWAECSSDAQRLDVFNGLLLAAHWDAAFDARLVSFDADGRVVVSPALSGPARQALDVARAPALPLASAHAPPLAWHRARLRP